MSKEEIALQLALSKIQDLQPSKGCSLSPSDENSTYNEALGKEIANLYNAIYNNLNCYKLSNDSDDSIDVDPVIVI